MIHLALCCIAENTHIDILDTELEESLGKNHALLYTGYAGLAITVVLAVVFISVVTTIACKIRRRQHLADDRSQLHVQTAVGSNDLV